MITKNISKIKGAYVLILKLNNEQSIQIGKFGKIQFKKGFYVYVGSALGTGGFRRVERHFNVSIGKNPTRKWHIDYLLPYTKIFCVVLIPTEKNIECELAAAITTIKDIQKIIGFGCTDCFCESHLFYSENDIKKEIVDICNIKASKDAFGKTILYQIKTRFYESKNLNKSYIWWIQNWRNWRDSPKYFS